MEIKIHQHEVFLYTLLSVVIFEEFTLFLLKRAFYTSFIIIELDFFFQITISDDKCNVFKYNVDLYSIN